MFPNSRFCGPHCKCTECHNNEADKKARENAIKSTLSRNPDAFSSKIEVLGNMFPEEIVVSKKNEKKKEQQSDAMLGHKRGCTCKKTMCRKKYCECFNAGVACSYLCKCENC